MGKKAENFLKKFKQNNLWFVFKIITIELSDQIRIKIEFEKASRNF